MSLTPAAPAGYFTRDGFALFRAGALQAKILEFCLENDILYLVDCKFRSLDEV